MASRQKIMRKEDSITGKGLQIMLTIAGIFLVLLLIFTGILFALSPGTPRPFLDKKGKPQAGSISEKSFVNINGISQGMFIKGKNADNPVLLYIHGGMPDYFLTEKYPTGLEDIFTVVWWEQRGSGLSLTLLFRPVT